MASRIMKAPMVINKDVLWDGRFLRVISLEFDNGQGRTFVWEAIERKDIEGIVAVVPVTVDEKVVLLRQFRPPLGMYVIEFPAGLNDQGESPQEVARRELLEETGFEPERIQYLIDAPLSSGLSTERLDVFVATGCRKVTKQDLEDVEIIDVLEVPLRGFYEGFLSLRSQDTILDPKVPGLIEIARHRGLIQ